MEHLPLDARSVVEQLRAAPRPRVGDHPNSWVPSQSFDSLILDAKHTPAHLSAHLAWLHGNWSLEASLAPPTRAGVRGWWRRVTHRAVVRALRPYLAQMQDCVGATVRSLDELARRLDDQEAVQLRTLGAVRSDLVDLATHVDERLEG